MKKKVFAIFKSIIIIFLILIFIDLFYKIEYSSKKVEKTLDNINIIVKNTEYTTIQNKILFEECLAETKKSTDLFLSERFIAFLFTIINISFIAIGIFLINKFASIKDKIEAKNSEIDHKIDNLENLKNDLVRQNILNPLEKNLNNSFLNLFTMYISLKYSFRVIKGDDLEGLYNSELQYIIFTESANIKNNIKSIIDRESQISYTTFEYGKNILNILKRKPYEKFHLKISDVIINEVDNILSELAKIKPKK
jgi:hypothetical protein